MSFTRGAQAYWNHARDNRLIATDDYELKKTTYLGVERVNGKLLTTVSPRSPILQGNDHASRLITTFLPGLQFDSLQNDPQGQLFKLVTGTSSNYVQNLSFTNARDFFSEQLETIPSGMNSDQLIIRFETKIPGSPYKTHRYIVKQKGNSYQFVNMI